MVSRDERRRYLVPGGIPQQTMHNQPGQVSGECDYHTDHLPRLPLRIALDA